MPVKTIEEYCYECGFLSRQEVEYIKERAEADKVSFAKKLLSLYPHKEEEFAKVFASFHGEKFLSSKQIKALSIDLQAFKHLDISTWKNIKAFPTRVSSNGRTRYLFIIADPEETDLLSSVELALKKDYLRLVGPASAILEKLIEYENAQEGQRLSERIKELTSPERATDLIDRLLELAVRQNASDVHLDPTHDGSIEVFFRVDGLLKLVKTYDAALHPTVVNVIFNRADLKTSDFIHLQDGQMDLDLTQSLGRVISLRVSSIPTADNYPSVVLRILDSKKSLPSSVQALGYSSYNVKRLEALYAKPYGIIFITGPTGSGKTTTLYTVLNLVNTTELKVVTIEDPVEYYVQGVVQCQINPEAGVTFARAVKGFLRHDPDIILVGEIRDNETASVAVQAAQTGHLVFSTLHTNTSIESVIRLRNIGIASYDIGDALLGVCAQRLIRKACPHCSEEIKAPKEFKKYKIDSILTPKKDEAGRNIGCSKCNNSGYKGRTLVSEVFVSTPEIKMALFDGAAPIELRKMSLKHGFVSLERDALSLLKRKMTTYEEIKRVLGPLKDMLEFEDRILKSYKIDPVSLI